MNLSAPTRLLQAATLLWLTPFGFAQPAVARPNIVLIVADDLGYRDLGCYGATRIQTPRIDQLASDGVRFTDAHSVCAVCNPSRYSILSGTYFWHAKRKADYSLYFHDGQVTLPSLLKSAGYQTAALGKWHNGFGRAPEPDWNAELKPGPIEIGFDSFFGTPKTHNEPPLVFVEDHQVVGLDPTDPISIDKTQGPHGTMSGGAKAQAARVDDQIDFVMARKAAEFFARQTSEKPFFLYLAFAAPHVPINPAPEFRGKSGAGLYGDYIQQLDHCTGLVLDALSKHGFADNTIVLFTSDNGGMYHRDALEAGHRTNGELLGQKTDGWEGGHRVPLIASWPGHTPRGAVRKELFSQVDFMATLAEATGVKLPEGASPDGASELLSFTKPAQAAPNRTEAVFLGTAGFVLRQGEWVYLPKQGSAGMTAPERKEKPWSQSYAKMGFVNSDIDETGQVKDGAPVDQLYHLGNDIGQSRNLTLDQPERAEAMRVRLEELTRKPVATTSAAKSGQTKVPSAPIPATTTPTLSDVPYGPHPKQVLHFWRANSEQPTPLLFFIHGGGWVGGDRMSGLGTLLKPMLAAGISVVSVEYRFLGEATTDGVTPPVKGPLLDAARALQFVRSKAADWNIDKNRVVASGGSAGACSSLWLAFHDDLSDPTSGDPVARESTRLSGVAVSGAQTTLDPAQMKEWTPNSYYGSHAFGIMKGVKNQPPVAEAGKFGMDFESFLARQSELEPLLREYSPFALVTADDPQVYLSYKSAPALGQPQTDPTHTANFGVKLQERLNSVGVSCELVYPGAPEVRHPTVEAALLEMLKR
ncbi:MAG: sulfatase-like hydrolase/transferase [Verrucomicrobiota bacterium]